MPGTDAAIRSRSGVILSALLAALIATPASAPAASPPPAGPPSAQLEKEHRITLRVIDAAAAEAVAIRSGAEVDADRLAGFLDFFQNFTDRCHHAKEERFYFAAALVYDDVEVAGQILDLTREHTYARGLLEEVAYLNDRQDGARGPMIAERLARYAELMREHIARENELVYARADLMLPEAEQQAMLEGFHRIERQELGEDFHPRYKALAEQLAGPR